MPSRRLTILFGFTLLISLGLAPLHPAATSAQGDQVRSIPVTAMLYGSVLSPDGQRVAIYENGALHNDAIELPYLPIRLIDLATGAETLLIGSTDYATDVAFTPDGTKLASYHGNGYIFLWDVASGTEIKRIPAMPGGSGAIDFLPDGKTLAVIAYTQLLLWDTESGSYHGCPDRRDSTLGQYRERMSSGAAESLTGLAVSPTGATPWQHRPSTTTSGCGMPPPARRHPAARLGRGAAPHRRDLPAIHFGRQSAGVSRLCKPTASICWMPPPAAKSMPSRYPLRQAHGVHAVAGRQPHRLD